MARSTEDGLSMAVAAGEVRGRFHAWLSPEDLLAMLGFLAGERGLIVKVSGPVYVKWKGTEPGGHASSFGELAAPGDFGRPFHAILLLDLEGECVRYLDPWYPSAGQPLSMSRDDLVAMYVGAAVDVRL